MEKKKLKVIREWLQDKILDLFFTQDIVLPADINKILKEMEIEFATRYISDIALEEELPTVAKIMAQTSSTRKLIRFKTFDEI